MKRRRTGNVTIVSTYYSVGEISPKENFCVYVFLPIQKLDVNYCSRIRGCKYEHRKQGTLSYETYFLVQKTNKCSTNKGIHSNVLGRE